MAVSIQKFQDKLVDFPKYLKEWAFTFKGAVSLFCLLILLLFPLVTQNAYFLGIFVHAMIFTIFAASWDFLAGFTGQVSFGHAIFFGLSAYGVGAALVEGLPLPAFVGGRLIWVTAYLPWWSALIFGLILSLIVGFVIGIICLRLKGPYLALGTMVIALMLMNLFKIGQLKDIFWADEGITGVPALSPNPLVVYYTLVIIMVSSIIILIQITKSKMGTIFRSIRDDDTGAEASGINITKYKVIAFIISGLFAGLAGGLFVMYNRSVNPLVFQPLYSFTVLIMAALGGIATISGSALGAFIFVFLSEVLRDLDKLAPANPILSAFSDPSFVFSILLILIIRFASEGILKSALERLKDLWDVLLGR